MLTILMATRDYSSDTVELPPWFWLFVIGIVVFVYVVYAWSLYRVGKKLGYERCWMAWVPIAQYWMTAELSKLEPTVVWFAALVIPSIINNLFHIPFIGLVSTVVLIILFWKIYELCGYNGAFSLLWLTCIGGMIMNFVVGSGEPVTPGIPPGYKVVGYGYPQGYDQYGNPVYPQQYYPPQGYPQQPYPQQPYPQQPYPQQYQQPVYPQQPVVPEQVPTQQPYQEQPPQEQPPQAPSTESTPWV